MVRVRTNRGWYDRNKEGGICRHPEKREQMLRIVASRSVRGHVNPEVLEIVEEDFGVPMPEIKRFLATVAVQEFVIPLPKRLDEWVVRAPLGRPPRMFARVRDRLNKK